MTVLAAMKRCGLPLLLLVVLTLYGCGIASTYRPADKKTIRDYSGNSKYHQMVGVLVLLNTSTFTGDQVSFPFMTAFLEGIEATASQAMLAIPGKTEVAPFQWDPPRIANGDLDVFALAGLARQAGMNFIVSPMIMDIRVRTHDTGFWLFRDVAHHLQIQTAAVVYDAATGARLDLGMLTDDVDIDVDQAQAVLSGKEMVADELTEIVEEMGEALGERMGEAVNDSQWLATVVAVTDQSCVISSGSNVGIAVDDRFDVLDGSRMVTGLDGQRYIVPGEKLGELIIDRVTERQSSGKADSGEVFPAGSLIVPQP